MDNLTNYEADLLAKLMQEYGENPSHLAQLIAERHRRGHRTVIKPKDEAGYIRWSKNESEDEW